MPRSEYWQGHLKLKTMYNLTVELHSGICWYITEIKVFTTKQEAEKYYHKNYHRDNSTWYLTKI